MSSKISGIRLAHHIYRVLRLLVGVKVYVIDSASTTNAEEVLQHVKRVIRYVATENRSRRGGVASDNTQVNSVSSQEAAASTTLNNHSFQRCLLYLDGQGRLYNLTLSTHSIGPASRYMEYLTTFSNMEAIIALTILCRSVPCIFNENAIQNLKPAYLSLVLGLVLTEEISLSWLNASMMIRSTPSVSAHTLYSPVGSDTFRRVVLLVLVFAGIAEGTYQSILTAVGILGASILLLANLGARSWYFLNWKPISYNGTGSFVLAYCCAIVTGIAVPFMGHRLIRMGGKGAVEYLIATAFWVAVAFVISDYDGIQKFLVLGSESEVRQSISFVLHNVYGALQSVLCVSHSLIELRIPYLPFRQLCDQNPVNVTVGIWWTVTFLTSLVLVRRIPYRDMAISTSAATIGERLLMEDHASPVGYKVPSLPDFELDPTVANTGLPCVSMSLELLFGVIMAMSIGTILIGLAFTVWDDDVHETIEGTL